MKPGITIEYLQRKYAGHTILKAADYRPDVEDLKDWEESGGCYCCGMCGCDVEIDGHCPNGYPSWFLALGYV